jgi:hypothetical protein
MSSSEKKYENVPDSSRVGEPEVDYEKAELDLIRNALSRSHSERFDLMMSLIKTSIMLKNAKVTHQPDLISKQ